MVLDTAGLPAGPLALETILRSPLVVVADPVVAASGPPVTVDELEAAVVARSSARVGSPPHPPVPEGGGGEAVLLERPAGTILAFANSTAAGLFVWVGRSFLAVVADPGGEAALAPVGELRVGSGRLVVGAPEVLAAWGADVDTGDGSPVRARMHRGRTRLGLIVVAHTPIGPAAVTVGASGAGVTFPARDATSPPLPFALAG